MLFGLNQMRPHARTAEDRDRIEMATIGVKGVLAFIALAIVFVVVVLVLVVILVVPQVT